MVLYTQSPCDKWSFTDKLQSSPSYTAGGQDFPQTNKRKTNMGQLYLLNQKLFEDVEGGVTPPSLYVRMLSYLPPLPLSYVQYGKGGGGGR